MLFVVLAAAFPIVMPFLAVSLVIGSLITAALRLRAAHHELTAQQLRTHAAALHDDSGADPSERCALAEVAYMAIVDHSYGLFISIAECQSTSTWVRCTSTSTPVQCFSCGSRRRSWPGRHRGARLAQARAGQKWRTWVLIAPVVGFPMWIGEVPPLDWPPRWPSSR